MHDPRPLIAEPLALDLANTEWVSGGRHRDLLAEPDGAATWLAAVRRPDVAADLAALAETRAAIRAALVGDASALNAVLAHGRLAERLDPSGPVRALDLDDERWRVPWLAAQNLLELMRNDPDRIRRCANAPCRLYFYDSSRGGRRQWCSMATCGNRAKARRHYQRIRAQ